MGLRGEDGAEILAKWKRGEPCGGLRTVVAAGASLGLPSPAESAPGKTGGDRGRVEGDGRLRRLAMSYRVPVLLAGLCLGLLAGCAHAPSAPPVPPAPAAGTPIAPDVLAQLGTIGVLAPGDGPPLDIETPARFSTAGAAAGMAKGFGLGLLGAAGCFLTIGRLAEACFLALGTPVWMVAGAKEGAETKEAPPEVARHAPALQDAVRNAKAQDVLRDRIVELARAQDRHSLLRLVEAEPPPSCEGIDYGRWGGDEIATVLKLRVSSVVLKQTEDPPLAMTMRVESRLIRAADGAELDLRVFEHRGAGHPIAAWAADDAKRFRDALDGALQTLAGDILQALYPESPANEPDRPLAGLGFKGVTAWAEPAAAPIGAKVPCSGRTIPVPGDQEEPDGLSP